MKQYLPDGVYINELDPFLISIADQLVEGYHEWDQSKDNAEGVNFNGLIQATEGLVGLMQYGIKDPAQLAQLENEIYTQLGYSGVQGFKTMKLAVDTYNEKQSSLLDKLLSGFGVEPPITIPYIPDPEDPYVPVPDPDSGGGGGAGGDADSDIEEEPGFFSKILDMGKAGLEYGSKLLEDKDYSWGEQLNVGKSIDIDEHSSPVPGPSGFGAMNMGLLNDIRKAQNDKKTKPYEPAELGESLGEKFESLAEKFKGLFTPDDVTLMTHEQAVNDMARLKLSIDRPGGIIAVDDRSEIFDPDKEMHYSDVERIKNNINYTALYSHLVKGSIYLNRKKGSVEINKDILNLLQPKMDPMNVQDYITSLSKKEFSTLKEFISASGLQAESVQDVVLLIIDMKRNKIGRVQ